MPITTTVRGPKPRRLATNPFGIQLNTNTASGLFAARQLGGKFFRPSTATAVADWDGTERVEITIARNAGYDIVFTVKNTDSPTGPVTNVNAYKTTLGQILDAVKPKVLAVENEVTDAQFFTGTMAQYEITLMAAVEVAKAKNIIVVNDGMSSDNVFYAVWADYLESGKAGEGRSILSQALGSDANALMTVTALSQLNAATQSRIARVRACIDIYRRSNIDYVNLHCYTKSVNVLDEVFNWWENKTGKKVATNEIGQMDTIDPNDVLAKLDYVYKRNLPFAVWYTVLNPTGNAKSLVETTGVMRSTGQIFRDYQVEKSLI